MTNAEISRGIAALYPGAKFQLSGDDYANIVWLDERPLPTEAEIMAAAVDGLKRQLSDRVDADAEALRLKYISPGAGMAMTYAEKKDQAIAVLSMGQAAANALANHGAAEFPTLSASVPVEAADLYAAAQLVMQKYEAFAAISRGIEAKRLAGKKSIRDASDAAAAQAAYEAITWTA